MALSVQSDGVVVLATLDRQSARNALDVETLLGLARLLVDPPGRAVVLTGAGEASFCAGMDLRVLRSAPPGEVAEAIRAMNAALNANDRVPVALGLVNRLVPAGDAVAVASALARKMAENGPVAVRMTRSLMRRTYEQGVLAAREASAAASDSPDVRAEMAEGVAAFVEKRSPRWPAA